MPMCLRFVVAVAPGLTLNIQPMTFSMPWFAFAGRGSKRALDVGTKLSASQARHPVVAEAVSAWTTAVTFPFPEGSGLLFALRLLCLRFSPGLGPPGVTLD